MSENQLSKASKISQVKKFSEILVEPIEQAAEIVSKLFAVLPPGLLPFSISIDPVTKNIDQRVARLDEARNALMESLQAIDELRREADGNKLDLARVIAELSAVKVDKAEAERELFAVKKAVDVDVEVFRSIARIPDDAQVKRERLIGFVTGVLASVIASAIWWAGAKIIG
ncbi:hypothetical protein [Duganella sp. HH105]|uniref:hypothetical protein n=1 Tax=Duganella sp. HH105 TaxID=1781067 RepID=UPI000877D675|nr:hypothetical protein [Duganella sp. HH105]